MAGTQKGVRKTKRRYGKECYQKWGKKGGNPHVLAMKGKKYDRA